MTANRVDVAGVRHAAAQHPWALLWLAERINARAVAPVSAMSLWDEPVPVLDGDRVPVNLVAEPSNPADANAVRVEIPVLEDGTWHRHVGYIPRALAKTYAVRLYTAAPYRAWVAAVRLAGPGDLKNPGLSIYVEWL